MPTSYFSTAFVRVPLAGYAQIENLDWMTLAQRIRQPEFLEALYIASPALYEEAVKLNLTQEPDEKAKRIVYSLIKYLSRYATRCTPFGLFGGFSTLPVTNAATEVTIKHIGAPRKVIRLDMNYLCALTQDLEKHPHVKPYLHFYPNTSLYSINGQYRYIEYRYNAAGMRMHHLSSADQSEYLDSVLTQAKAGVTVGQLVTSLVSEEITEEEAAEFVEQVIASQLLVSELEPALTGDDFLVQILRALLKIQNQHPSEELQSVMEVLKGVKAALERIETSGEDYSTGKFGAVEQWLAQLPTPFDRKVLFQIDTYLPETEGQLNRGLLNKLVSKIPTLMKLSPGGNSLLDDFRNKFQERYEDEEVPFVLALDPEVGIGFPAGQSKNDISPLIEGIGVNGSGGGDKTVSISQEHTYLLRKIAEAQLTGVYQIDINEEDLRQTEPRQPYLPLTNTAMFSVIRENGREKLFLDSFGGATGTFLLGRFGHTDPSVLNLLQEISRAEDERLPEVIFADIVHLPEARTGNVIIRPQLKQYQIPFLSKSSSAPEYEVPITDLMIRVQGNQIVLRSESLNKIIIPRLSNAHNYSHSNSLDIYHFLCAVQGQNVRTGLSGVIGNFSSLFMFLPRVVLDNVILSEAQWNFREVHLKGVVAAFKTNNWAKLKAEVDQWRAKFSIPRYVCLMDFDNELYVDLENQCLVETFVNEIKSREQWTVKEFLHTADDAVVHSERGWHTNQFVVAFDHTSDYKWAAPAVKTPKKAEPEPVRKFFIGSEWLYYKVYTGIKTADWLLTEVLLPLTERFKAEGWTDRFFFIRYADPNLHFRLRFHFTDPQFVGRVVQELHDALAPYLANKTVSSISNDTYNRELERYGSNSIDAVEDYFHADSDTILQFLSLIGGAEGEECRWRFGMQLTDDLLTAFGMDWKQRLDFTEQRAADFGREFGYNAALKKQLDGRYKEIEASIQELFDRANPEHTFFYELSQKRSERLQLMIQYVRNLAAEGQLQISLEDLLASLIHMNINRLFRSQQRFAEYSVFYHLHKYYRIVYGRTVLAKKSADVNNVSES
ncbi:MAG: lantibiotic dehydratase [Spirosomataceae bacterium]